MTKVTMLEDLESVDGVIHVSDPYMVRLVNKYDKAVKAEKAAEIERKRVKKLISQKLGFDPKISGSDEIAEAATEYIVKGSERNLFITKPTLDTEINDMQVASEFFKEDELWQVAKIPIGELRDITTPEEFESITSEHVGHRTFRWKEKS